MPYSTVTAAVKSTQNQGAQIPCHNEMAASEYFVLLFTGFYVKMKQSKAYAVFSYIKL
jgi:hypothetical protein